MHTPPGWPPPRRSPPVPLPLIRRIGLEGDGRPVRLCRDAQGQISLALMLTGYTAAAWA